MKSKDPLSSLIVYFKDTFRKSKESFQILKYKCFNLQYYIFLFIGYFYAFRAI